MSITYTKQGDYLLPDLTLEQMEEQEIGVWGQRHLRYLKEHRKITYCNLLTSGTLVEYLVDIERQAAERFSVIVAQMKEKEGLTEELKANDMLEWTRRVNNICASAREIVMAELICV